jgi:hypothetical protein
MHFKDRLPKFIIILFKTELNEEECPGQNLKGRGEKNYSSNKMAPELKTNIKGFFYGDKKSLEPRRRTGKI